MADKDDTFLKELCEYHISGQLRVAPNMFLMQSLRGWVNRKMQCMNVF